MPLSPLAAVSQLRAFATRRGLEGALQRIPASFSGCCHPVLIKLPVPRGARVAFGSDMWAPRQLCLSSEAPVSQINGSVNFLTTGLGRAAPWLSSSSFPTSYQKTKPPTLFLYLPLPGFLERQLTPSKYPSCWGSTTLCVCPGRDPAGEPLRERPQRAQLKARKAEAHKSGIMRVNLLCF